MKEEAMRIRVYNAKEETVFTKVIKYKNTIGEEVTVERINENFNKVKEVIKGDLTVKIIDGVDPNESV